MIGNKLRQIEKRPPITPRELAVLRLTSLGRTTNDVAKRGDIYKQIVKILNEDQPWLVYYNNPQISTVRKSVQNYPQTYNGYWGVRDLDKVWRSK